MLALSLARRIDVAKPCEIDRSVVRESDRAKGAGPIRRAGFPPLQIFCILPFRPSTKLLPIKMLSSPTPSITRISVSSGPFDGTRMTRFVPARPMGIFFEFPLLSKFRPTGSSLIGFRLQHIRRLAERCWKRGYRGQMFSRCAALGGRPDTSRGRSFVATV
jgi:hypothetical protein